MSVHAVHQSHQVAQANALSQAQAARRHSSQRSALPEDNVTISAEAQAKQAASAIGADRDHDRK